MRYFIKIGLLFLIVTSCKSQVNKPKISNENRKGEDLESIVYSHDFKTSTLFITGAENYTSYLSLLKNKKVGVVTNPSGILKNFQKFDTLPNGKIIAKNITPIIHLVDFLIEKNIKIEKRDV